MRVFGKGVSRTSSEVRRWRNRRGEKGRNIDIFTISSSPHHPITPSPHHPITQSPHLLITPSPHHPITPSPHHPITKSPNHPIYLYRIGEKGRNIDIFTISESSLIQT
ncbi:MAG: hypothetical protein F6K22_23385 [Okeania sp. SIO2F4]|uniref:hypothetical protein n=1 Tax=Okeania sp. SIO2F4 TaxID=2607790 RepID=UPI00142A39B9|nr:hypothetical protein [Okeania sp. SIO2F4]NES05494.1 hypothetical protein [Okeania sp. SIO2F4]